jgi:hypothetical protein
LCGQQDRSSPELRHETRFARATGCRRLAWNAHLLIVHRWDYFMIFPAAEQSLYLWGDVAVAMNSENLLDVLGKRKMSESHFKCEYASFS